MYQWACSLQGVYSKIGELLSNLQNQQFYLHQKPKTWRNYWQPFWPTLNSGSGYANPASKFRLVKSIWIWDYNKESKFLRGFNTSWNPAWNLDWNSALQINKTTTFDWGFRPNYFLFGQTQRNTNSILPTYFTLGNNFTKDLGAKYLVFFSSRSLKFREKCISFAQLALLSLYIFLRKCVDFSVFEW